MTELTSKWYLKYKNFIFYSFGLIVGDLISLIYQKYDFLKYLIISFILTFSVYEFLIKIYKN